MLKGTAQTTKREEAVRNVSVIKRRPFETTMKLLAVAVVLLSFLCGCRAESAANNNGGSDKNRFEQGCLYANNVTRHLRVCGSEDPPDAAWKGLCRVHTIEYPEVRIIPGDWESVRCY